MALKREDFKVANRFRSVYDPDSVIEIIEIHGDYFIFKYNIYPYNRSFTGSIREWSSSDINWEPIYTVEGFEV